MAHSIDQKGTARKPNIYSDDLQNNHDSILEDSLRARLIHNNYIDPPIFHTSPRHVVRQVLCRQGATAPEKNVQINTCNLTVDAPPIRGYRRRPFLFTAIVLRLKAPSTHDADDISQDRANYHLSKAESRYNLSSATSERCCRWLRC